LCLIAFDDVIEEDINQCAKQIKYKEGDIHYNKNVKIDNGRIKNNDGMLYKFESSILREVYFSCRIAIRGGAGNVNIKKNEQIYINYSYFIY